MAVSELTSENALSAGCDLWIVADDVSSKWTRRIDWYLNFQIARARHHQPATPMPEMSQVLAEFEVEAPPITTSGRLRPLMVASSWLVPASKTVVVPDSEDGEQWISRCRQIWTDLGFPKARIFLPDHLDAEFARGSWRGEMSRTVEIVPVGALTFDSVAI